MAKRQASNQLNHDNWDQEEEPEEPGMFEKVSDSELSQRVIKTAKRRLPKESTTNPFASFQGFGTKNTNASTNNNSSSFSVFTSSHTLSNGNLNTKSKSSVNSLTEKEVTDNLQKNPEVQSKDSLRDNEYYRLLKGLNESLAQWIQQHVEKTPLCDFTPVFRDYEKHLKDLETRFPPFCDKSNVSSGSNVNYSGDLPSEDITDNPKVPSNTTKTSTSATYTVPKSTFSFCNNSNNNSSPIKYTFSNLNTTSSTSPVSTTTTTNTKISFGALNSSNSSAASSQSFKFGLQTPAVSFGNIQSSTTTGTVSTPTISTSFTINASKSKTPTEIFSLSSSVTQNQEKKEVKDNEVIEGDEDEENTEPPKNEFTPVIEEEALYSKRCKLFYSKEGNYVEKGVGVLYLKNMDSKVQLLVRADTNLGNILLNIMLTDTLPIKRVGKNNVLIVCVPNPPIYPKQEGTEAIPLLIRVKTTEEADELLQKLEEQKS